MLTTEQKIRYARMIGIDSIGEPGMVRIINGRVLIIGAGALGSVCAMYLAGAGVGTLGIAEFDTIDLSNLQRQVFYSTSDCGASKLAVISRRIKDLNSDVNLIQYPFIVKEENAREIFREYDFVIDATDNPNSKMMTDKVGAELEIPYCIGGVREAEGQVMSWQKGSIRYSDIFPEAGCNGFTPCSISGVLGPAAGMVASIQSAEALKFLAGVGQMLFNRLWIYNIFTLNSKIIAL